MQTQSISEVNYVCLYLSGSNEVSTKQFTLVIILSTNDEKLH